MDNGIVYRDITLGKGYSPSKGDTVAVHYSLFYDDLEVESSRESQGLAALPLGFSFGAESGPGAAMKGLNLGIVGMKVGGLRLITIPSKFAFGEKGKLPLIPPNATVSSDSARCGIWASICRAQHVLALVLTIFFYFMLHFFQVDMAVSLLSCKPAGYVWHSDEFYWM